MTAITATKGTDFTNMSKMKAETKSCVGWVKHYYMQEAKSIPKVKRAFAWVDGKEVYGYVTKKYSKKRGKKVAVFVSYAERKNSSEPSSFKFTNINAFDGFRLL